MRVEDGGRRTEDGGRRTGDGGRRRMERAVRGSAIQGDQLIRLEEDPSRDGRRGRRKSLILTPI